MEEPDLITVSESARAEVPADHADLYVTIRGSSLVTGQEALKKAREVGALVADLASVGVDEKEIALQGVEAEVSTGLLGRSSSARYRLRVRCLRLDTLPDVLGAVTSQKTAALDRIEWGYGDTTETRDRLTDECVERANRKARRVAGGLKVRLLGVHSYVERLTDSEYPVSYPRHAMAPQSKGSATRGRMTAEDLGLEVTHSKTLQVEIDVAYRISGFEEAQ